MKRILPSDVFAAARALLCVPARARSDLARRLVLEAEAAAGFVTVHRKAHRQFGNGTLQGAAHAHGLGREVSFGDRDFLECQMIVLQALLQRP